MTAVAGAVLGPLTAPDAAYFAQNPGTVEYVRQLIPGEFDPAPDEQLPIQVRVVKTTDGRAVREPVTQAALLGRVARPVIYEDDLGEWL